MRRVLITGGRGDIAMAIRKLLLDNGYDVLSPSKEEMDVTDVRRIQAVIQEYKPNILINNAGYLVPQSIKNADVDCTIRHIDVNLTGTFVCSEIGLQVNPNLQIINIASAASVESHATWSEYCATKAGVVMATKCWAEDGIDAVAISPGRTRSKMRKMLYPNEDQTTLLEPEDFAKVVLMAINHKFDPGTNIIVRKQTVDSILRG